MFVVLYKSPKHIPYILGKDHGIPKPVFVILCVGLAFVLFALLTALFPVPESTQNSVESGDRASESFSTSSSIVEESTPGKTSEASNSKNNPFSGDCGIAASGKIGTNIIGYPTLTIDIENISDKDISAIQFYVVPYDVYGEEITTLWTFSQHHLYTDDTIAAGHSDELYYDPFIEDSIKTMKLYVYSVYFADGTEWGDKDASESTILKKGIPIEVSGES